MAQKLKFGNGTWANKEGSTLAYNDEGNNYKPLPFSFERDSIATRVNKEGLIEVVGKDIPRIDYTDSADGVLLLENSSTNYVLKSDDILSTYQSQNGNVSDANTPINSFNNSIQIEYDASNSSLVYKRDFNPTIGTKYTISCFVQMNDNSEPLQTVDGNSGDFSLINNNTTVNASDIKTERIGFTNVYKVSATKTSTDTNNRFGIIKYSTQSLKGFKVSGFQLEQGSYPTSYIPTSGSTVQRAAETANGSGNSEVFNSQEGILYVRMNAFDNNSRISLSDGSTSNRVSFKITDDNIDFQYRVGGNYSYRVNVDVNNYLTNKILVSYNNGLFVGYLNGFAISDKISGTSLGSSVLNRLNLNDGSSADDFKGNIKEIAVYDEILTDLELETLTSYRSLNELVTELNLNTL